MVNMRQGKVKYNTFFSIAMGKTYFPKPQRNTLVDVTTVLQKVGEKKYLLDCVKPQSNIIFKRVYFKEGLNALKCNNKEEKLI